MGFHASGEPAIIPSQGCMGCSGKSVALIGVPSAFYNKGNNPILASEIRVGDRLVSNRPIMMEDKPNEAGNLRTNFVSGSPIFVCLHHFTFSKTGICRER